MHIYAAYHFSSKTTIYRKVFPNKVIVEEGFKGATLNLDKPNIEVITTELKKQFHYDEVTIINLIPLGEPDA